MTTDSSVTIARWRQGTGTRAVCFDAGITSARRAGVFRHWSQGHDQLGPLGCQRQLPEQFAELLNKVVVVAVTRSPRQRPGPRTGQQCRRCRAGCVAAAPASSRHLSPKTKRLLGAAAIVVVVLLAGLVGVKVLDLIVFTPAAQASTYWPVVTPRAPCRPDPL